MSGRSRWMFEPKKEGGYHDEPVRHLFDPGHNRSLCGLVQTPQWRSAVHGLRCENCVKEEEGL